MKYTDAMHKTKKNQIEIDVKILYAHPVKMLSCFRPNQKCVDIRTCSGSQWPVRNSIAALVAAENVASETLQLVLNSAPNLQIVHKIPTLSANTNLRRKYRYPMR
jgi:hypothetical protein